MSQPQMHTLPAFNKVIAVPELEELILFHLSINEILRVQIVSHHWQDLITRSPSIQKKLFLQPNEDASGKPQLNPLLKELFPLLLRTQCAAGCGFRCPDEAEMVSLIQLMEEPFFSDPDKRARVLREDASWRKMFPIQPPARIHKTVQGNGVWFFKSAIFGTFSSNYESINDPGARMGFIYDYFVQLLADYHQIEVGIHWRMFPGGDQDEDGLLTQILEPVSDGVDAQEDEESVLSAGLQQIHVGSALKNEIDLYFFLLCECMCPDPESSCYNGWEQLVVKKQEMDVTHYETGEDGYIKPVYNVAAPGQANPEY